MNSRNIVLLTATIKPKTEQHQFALTNVDDRLSDYTKALNFYYSKVKSGGIDRLIFVDNSGYDLAELSAQFRHKHIEFISFYGLDYPEHYHRGYGEFKLIEYAHKNSIILSELSDCDHVWKVTGRYIIRNISNFLMISPRDFDLYMNENDKKNWIDMEVMAWSKKGFNHVVHNVWEKFADGLPPEIILFHALNDLCKDEIKLIKKYYYPPLIDGRRGSDGSSFLGRFGYIKFILKAVIKILYLPIRSLGFGS